MGEGNILLVVGLFLQKKRKLRSYQEEDSQIVLWGGTGCESLVFLFLAPAEKEAKACFPCMVVSLILCGFSLLFPSSSIPAEMGGLSPSSLTQPQLLLCLHLGPLQALVMEHCAMEHNGTTKFCPSLSSARLTELEEGMRCWRCLDQSQELVMEEEASLPLPKHLDSVAYASGAPGTSMLKLVSLEDQRKTE